MAALTSYHVLCVTYIYVFCASILAEEVLEYGLSASQRAKILEDHNKVRSKMPATDMPRMSWWKRGALEAARMADSCEEKPRTIDGYILYATDNVDFKPEDLVTELEKEKDAYSDITNQCIYKKGKCDDYRQMIVSSNAYVGCAVKSCAAGIYTHADGKKEAKPMRVIVCTYPHRADTGLSRHQYTKGTHCSKCSHISPGLWCKDNLCSSQDDCTDSPSCANVAQEKCTSDEDIKKKCPLKCGQCTCKVECENCGTRSKTGCGCDCIPGYYGGICRQKCKNLSSTNCTAESAHMCQLYSKKREMCPLLCDLCKYDPDPACKPPKKPISLSQKAHAVIDKGRKIDCRKQIWCLKGRPFLEGSTCKCHCSGGYQGKLCNKVSDEAANGVILTIEGKSEKYTEIYEVLIDIVANELNRFCGSNVETCCPYEPKRQVGSTSPKYTDKHQIHVGKGYPDFADTANGRFDVLIYALYEPENTLCTVGGTKFERKKRDTGTTGCPVGFKRMDEKCIYDVKVPRDIVYNALRHRISDMNRKMCCGAQIDYVNLAEVNVKPWINKRADIKTKFHDWENAIIILAIIMGGFMIFLILSIFFQKKKARDKADHAVKREEKRGETFIQKMEQAVAAKRQQEREEQMARQKEGADPYGSMASQSEVGYPYGENQAYEHEYAVPQQRTDTPSRLSHGNRAGSLPPTPQSTPGVPRRGPTVGTSGVEATGERFRPSNEPSKV